ncbi:hypothetical protein V1517DRAFT_317774 [Lipomyces orientalis]|uniref:Uncharacterized protein n=1 Tax=Lipomyces orientalis TaxID=1233043 RepID=A0ACC3TT68_9ASCO
MSVRDIESFPIQKHSYCKVPFNNAPTSSSISWTHSPYRDSLVIAFDPTISEIVRIKVMWRSEILEDVDVAAIKKLNISQSPLTVIVRSPCIGIKYAFRDLYGQIMVRRFQLRFANDELFAACLRQFEKYGCLIKGASGITSMSGTQSKISSTQQSVASVTEGGSQSTSSRSYLPSSLSSISSYSSQHMKPCEGNIGIGVSFSDAKMLSQSELDGQLPQSSGPGALAAMHANSRHNVASSMSEDTTQREGKMGINGRLDDIRVLSQPDYDSQWVLTPGAGAMSSFHSTAPTAYPPTARECDPTLGSRLLNNGSMYRPATDKTLLSPTPPKILSPLVYSPLKSVDSSYISAANTSITTNTLDSPVSRTEDVVRDDYQPILKMPSRMEQPILSSVEAASNTRTFERKRNLEDIHVSGFDDNEIGKMIADTLKDPTFMNLLHQVNRVLMASNQS